MRSPAPLGWLPKSLARASRIACRLDIIIPITLFSRSLRTSSEGRWSLRNAAFCAANRAFRSFELAILVVECVNETTPADLQTCRVCKVPVLGSGALYNELELHSMLSRSSGFLFLVQELYNLAPEALANRFSASSQFTTDQIAERYAGLTFLYCKLSI